MPESWHLSFIQSLEMSKHARTVCVMNMSAIPSILLCFPFENCVETCVGQCWWTPSWLALLMQILFHPPHSRRSQSNREAENRRSVNPRKNQIAHQLNFSWWVATVWWTKWQKEQEKTHRCKFFEKCFEFLKISIFQWSLCSRWKLFMRWQKVKGYSDIQDYQRFWRILRKSLKNCWNSWRFLSLWYLGSLGVFATVSELQWLMSHGMDWTLDKYLRINLVTVASSIFS